MPIRQSSNSMTDFTDPVMDDIDILASECHGTSRHSRCQNAEVPKPIDKIRRIQFRLRYEKSKVVLQSAKLQIRELKGCQGYVAMT